MDWYVGLFCTEPTIIYGMDKISGNFLNRIVSFPRANSFSEKRNNVRSIVWLAHSQFAIENQSWKFFTFSRSPPRSSASSFRRVQVKNLLAIKRVPQLRNISLWEIRRRGPPPTYEKDGCIPVTIMSENDFDNHFKTLLIAIDMWILRYSWLFDLVDRQNRSWL